VRSTAGLPVILAVLVLAIGCTPVWAQRDDARAVTSAPEHPLTVVADAHPAASAVSSSRAVFDKAGVAVVAREGDPVGMLLAASAAVGLGVPLLIEPRDGGLTADPLRAELDRLGAATMLAVGSVDAKQSGSDSGRNVVAVPADPEAVSAAIGVDLGAGDPVAPGAEVAAVAALDPRRPAALRPAGAASAPPTHARTDARLPRVARAKPLDGVLVLAGGSPESLAGVATARAAGARVQPTGGQADPRGSTDVITALEQHPSDKVVALGANFAGESGLDWKLATARAGTQLPGGGQLLFPGRLLVALYGAPGTAALGVLGEQDLPASIQRAREHAAAYQPLVPTPVVPTFEIIATIASQSPGPDGNYSTETDPDTLRPWVQAAGRAGLYVVLDLQPGRTDFLAQAQAYRSLLELPNVGLALDPEWRLGPNQQHLTEIGSVGVDEVNRVITWLADLTRTKALPQKLLVVHQFQLRMIADRQRLDTTHDELAVLVNADGQGSPPTKQDTWAALHQNLPAPPLYWGWKNFHDEDLPMLTPQQTIAQVHPAPNLISY
jgi:hypothetical protein